MASNKQLPASVRQWQRVTERMPCTDIHFINKKLLKSGSKVTQEQFYALRVLRRRYQLDEMDAGHLAHLGIADLRPAREILEAHPQWHQFLDAVENVKQRPTASLGMFAIVLRNQRMACGTVVFKEPAPTMTLRTRAPIPAEPEEDDCDTDKDGEETDINEEDGEDDEGDNEGNDDADNEGNDAADNDGDDDEDDKEDDEEENNEEDEDDDDSIANSTIVHPLSTPPRRTQPAISMQATPETPATRADLGTDAFRRTDDEAVVNKALIDTAQAVTQLAHDGGRLDAAVDWTMQRAAFRVFAAAGAGAGGGGKLYEAKNDGHLSRQSNAGPGEPKLSVEIKADIRAAGDAVKFQEAAQFAAWIAAGRAAGRAAEVTWWDDGSYRRINVAQNRHEAYISCAAFTEKYVQYITNEPRRRAPAPQPAQEDEFMLISEYGPFNMMKRSHVRKLHVLLLALIIKHGKIELPPRRKN